MQGETLMTPRAFLSSHWALLGLALAGPTVAAEPVSLQPWATEAKADAIVWLPTATNAWGGADRVAASERDGLLLLDASGRVRARLPGQFEHLDSRPLEQGGALLATFDRQHRQPLLQVLGRDGRWGETLDLPKPEFAVNGQCLYRDTASNLFLFLVGENGQGEQWLVGHGERLADEAWKVRRLAFPPTAEQCRSDDASDTLFVDEPEIGLWAYGAHPEAEGSRIPVDLTQPYGHLNGSVGGLAVVQGGLLVLDKGPVLQRYARAGERWESLGALSLEGVRKPEQLSVRERNGGLDLLLQDDKDERYYQGRAQALPKGGALPAALPEVRPTAQTESVDSQGDAADDPAIWVNPKNPQQSRVLGTDKQQGLMVFDLAGKRLQRLESGLVNNVDLRYGFDLGGRRVDLAVASNRSDNSLTLYGIDPASGKVSEIGRVSTPLDEVYGVCLYAPRAGDIQAFVNDKDGRFLQYRLSAPGGKIKGELLRQFAVESQPEGCVADDKHQRLFLGEEDVGVWTVNADPGAPATLQPVLTAGDILQADVEGMALYQGAKASYLVVSSQGNDSYVVLDAQAPYRVRGAFRVGLNLEAGIDGTSETDGIEATSANLGGAYARGMLVVQDGRKRLPEGTQNFKYVPWDGVARALNLN